MPIDICTQSLLTAGLMLLTGAVTSVIARNSLSARLYSWWFLAASILLLFGACMGWQQHFVWQAPNPIYLGLAPLQLKIDSTASIFAGLLALVSMAVSIYSPDYLEHLKDEIDLPLYWFCLFIFVFGMAGVVLAANALTFLLFWELMSLSSAALVASDHTNHRAEKSAIIYLGATRIATALIAAGFLWLHALSGSWQFADWHVSAAGTTTAFLLVLLGLCIKAGTWPCHIWLPYAHGAAPTPVSALMSAVMVKMAVYAIIRLFVADGICPTLFAYVLLGLGLVSSFWGILFALVQNDLKRLLAYSTVENVGIILTALGLCLYGTSKGLPAITSIGLTAAIFHCINHGLFKSLLFLGAGSVAAQAHSRNLEHLGGLGRLMPYTMLFFLIGAGSICALPPLNGFSSKWLVYQGMFQAALASHARIDATVAFAAMGVLALVGALALACFTKAIALTFFGRARTEPARHAHESGSGMLVAQWMLAACCVTLGVFASQFAQFVIDPLFGEIAPAHMVVHSWQYLPSVQLAVVFSAIALFVYATVFRNRASQVRHFTTWDCGFGAPTPRMQVNASSFAYSIANIFRVVLQYQTMFEIVGRDRRHFPEGIRADAQMVSLLESRVYGPVISSVRWLSAHVARLQAGSIHIYLLYMLLALVLLLFVGVKT